METRRKPTFGIMVGPVYAWSEQVRHAQKIESLGFDKLWLPDHFVNPGEPDMDWYDCWSTLAGLASCTSRIRLGTLVSSMTLRNPAVLARMAMSVDHISNGRLELGVGAAGARYCHAMTGVPRWEPRERSERYREFVEILDRLLRNEVTTYEGTYFQIQEAHIRPGPVQQPRLPLSIAAHGKKAIRLAARYGDAWNGFYPGKDLTPDQSSQATRAIINSLEDMAASFKRDPNTIERTFLFGWTSDPVCASIESFKDTIGRYYEAGVGDFAVLYTPGFPESTWKDLTLKSEAMLEQYAWEVIPSIQQELAGGSG